MTAYYNEIDPYCVQWLRNLINANLIPAGDVDDRSIADVQPDDLKGYTQCHFFAGLGGWSHALRLAMWPDDRPVWTGSCPCQPFSAAGKGKATHDDRHLWPVWKSLIGACQPSRVFGEQVEAAIGWGWLDLVYSDLEAEGYTVGAAVLPACGVGAPHIRQRLWFVGDSDSSRREGADILRQGRFSGRGPSGELRNTQRERLERLQRSPRPADDSAPGASFWSDVEWHSCSDGTTRPLKPGIKPLAHGLSGRVAKLRAAGNAIVPQVAAAFIRASQ